MIRLRKQIITLTILLICAVACSTVAFGEGDFKEFLNGSWAFPHDSEKTVMILAEDESAVFAGISYTWQLTDKGICLNAKDDSELIMTCERTEEGIILYIPTMFERTQGSEGLIGVWEAVGKSESSFIFATNGHFLEDGVFTGTYMADEESGTVTLQYGGLFEDTTIYYYFIEDYLVISYPWEMIRQ